MHKWLCATLAVLMLAANFPEAFCFCNSGARGHAPACPRCCCHRARPASAPDQGSKPCCCQVSKAIRAVPPPAAISAPALTFGGYFQPPAAVAASLPWAICRLPEIARVAGPPGSSEGAGRALPIFLGHLLI
ncbi:MAG: hypothetical protein ACLQLG_04290 [Thermoguttaceae bacterium]